MNKVVLVSATWLEIEPVIHFLKQYQGLSPETFFYGRLEITFCVTGAGMVCTAFELGKLNNRNIVFAINAGLGGSFGKHAIGDVVNVIDDRFPELGAEDGDNFISIDDLQLGKQKVSVERPLNNSFISKIPTASGITVNTVHGNHSSIEKVTGKYDPDIETMEGAAFIHAANSFGWQAIQLRAISNKVEKRNRDAWDVQRAIKALNEKVIGLLEDLNK
jgi:futalosine hydrolase